MEDEDDVVTDIFSRYFDVRRIASRLLVLATKHCPRGHHDWKEILEIAAKLDEEHK